MASVNRIVLQEATLLTATTTSTAKSIELLHHFFVPWLNVTTANGATTIAAKIQHSANGTHWVDLVTFANIVGTTGVQAPQGPYFVLPFVRSVVTLTGVTLSATVEVALYTDKYR